MDYFERLARRALAVPSSAESSLFDPFEQQAPWPMDPVAAAASVPARGQVPAAAAGLPLAVTGAAHHGTPPPTPADAAAELADVAQRTGVPAPLLPGAARVSQPASPQQVRPVPVVTQHDALPSALPGKRSELAEPVEPLGRADAFMRGLGVAAPVPAPSAWHQAAPPIQPAQVPHTSETTPALPMPRTARVPAWSSALDAAAGEARTAAPLPPIAVRPPKPAPAVMSAAPAAADVRGAPTSTPAVSAAHSRQRTAPAAVTSLDTALRPAVVLKLADRADALDDLAHGNSMARFGLGQL